MKTKTETWSEVLTAVKPSGTQGLVDW